MKKLLSTLIIALLPGSAALADTKLVAFPPGYKTSHVLYATVDKSHPKRGHSIRDIYINEAAFQAVKAGRPLPSGTVLTMAIYKASVKADKSPVRDANGRFEKDTMFGVFVMEKRDGWGASYPASLRNGSWEYARFHKNGKRHAKLDMKSCFGCHKRKAKDDFVFTLKQLKAHAAK